MPRIKLPEMITWSVWLSIQVRNLARSAWLWLGLKTVQISRHPFASLCATSTTTSISRWDENTAGLPGGHAVWMSTPDGVSACRS